MKMLKNLFITKAKIKHYLKVYPYLDQKIRERELDHIRFGPNFSEFKQNINTIEKQVIAMSYDYKLQEMRFYKQFFDKHYYVIKHMKRVSDEVVDYFYNIILKEY